MYNQAIWIVFGIVVVSALLVVLAGRPIRFFVRFFGARAGVDGRPHRREVDIGTAIAKRDIKVNAEKLAANTLEGGRDVLINPEKNDD